MERRILGWVLSSVHVVLVTVALAVAMLIGYGIWTTILYARGQTLEPDMPRWIWPVPIILLAGYWLFLGVLGIRAVRRGMRDALAGRFAEASERLRRFQDREVVFRLVGMPGWVFRHARVAEGATYWMYGMTSEAFSIAADESRGAGALARSAAAIAAAAAAETGDAHAWERLERWIERAEKNPRVPEFASILASRAAADLNALRLAEAERRAEALLAVDPTARGALAVRAGVRALRGDDAGAEADLVAARASALRDPNPLAVQLVDSLRAEVRRQRGDLDGAVEITATLAESWHRTPRLFARAIPGLRAAAAGDASAARRAAAEIEELADRGSFDPLLAANAGLALARIERRLGDPATARKRLAPALTSAHAEVRQQALAEEADCLDALGDAAGARASRSACAALSGETRLGRAAVTGGAQAT